MIETSLGARGESPVAFDRRCIPPRGVAPQSHSSAILLRRALPRGRLTGLDATRDFHHGLLEMTPAVPQMPSSDFVIRAAAKSEADAVFRLISDNLEAGHLLPRPLGEVVLHAPRFLVAADAAGVVACAELTELSPRVAEVRSLVVSGSHRGHGVGTQLLAEILATARAQGYPILCAFTHDPRLFVRLGFSIVPHHWVPEKISTDCHTCIWFRRCRQYAVVLDLKIKGSSHDRRA